MVKNWKYAGLAVLCFSLSGCGGGPAQLPVVTVPAKLVLDDKPYGPATLSLSAASPGSKIPPATGTVASDGSVDLKSYPNKPGIVPGEYVVLLLPDPMKIGTSPTADSVKVTVSKSADPVEIKMTSKKVRTGAPLGGGK
ncbi:MULTISPECIES: hypothetical protein [unclassified Schlesneria]|uniref:hypothetical protein n=1 Tax=unclassified Schlesneria TaxID=2762017 RepID=UPI002F15F646